MTSLHPLLGQNLSTFVSLTSQAATYDCTGGAFEPLKIEVTSASKITINDNIKVKANTAELRDSSKKSVNLVGDLSAFGDGLDGFEVTVKVTKYLFNNSKVAYLNTYNRGPEGFYSESYKCIKR